MIIGRTDKHTCLEPLECWWICASLGVLKSQTLLFVSSSSSSFFIVLVNSFLEKFFNVFTCSKQNNGGNILQNSESFVVMTHDRDGNCWEVFLQFTDMSLGNVFTCSKQNNSGNILKNSESFVVMTHDRDGNCWEVFLQFTDMSLGILKMSRTLFVSVFPFFFFVDAKLLGFTADQFRSRTRPAWVACTRSLLHFGFLDVNMYVCTYITAFASISSTAFEIEAPSLDRSQSIDSERKQKNTQNTNKV